MIDQMAYNYQTGTNKLNYIADPYHLTPADIEGQSANNYAYDAIGNLIQDVKGGLSSIAWNPYGKITQISKGTNGNLYYDYDAMGNRIKKNFTQSNDNADNTWYVRDASGNIMAIYSRKNYGTNQQVLLQNYELYGSSRLGSLNLGMAVEGDYNLTPTTNYTRLLGLKQYEISNHLGNVLTTFSDQRVFAPTGMSSTNSNALIAKLISAQDYYPFGMLMTGRSWNEDKTKYSFNGQEKDREIYNNENITTATFWEYDGRIGRRWNIDPKPIIGVSEYATFLNNPNLYTDKYGDNPIVWGVARWLAKRAIPLFLTGAAISTSVQFFGNYMVYEDAKKAAANIDVFAAAADGTIAVITGGVGTIRTLFKQGTAVALKKATSVLVIELISATTDFTFEGSKFESVFGGDKSLFNATSSFVLSLASNYTADQIKGILKKWVDADIDPTVFAPKTAAEKDLIRRIDKVLKSEAFNNSIDGTTSVMENYIDAVLNSKVKMEMRRIEEYEADDLKVKVDNTYYQTPIILPEIKE